MFMRRLALLLCFALPLSSGARVTRADVEQMLDRLSNWGRWGSSDERGALNLITREKRKQAAALLREGSVISLAHPAIKESTDDSPPFEHRMLETGLDSKTGASDAYAVRYHGFTVTHVDALCHIFWNGKMYNGFSQREVTDKGAGKLSIERLRHGIVTHAILVDLPRLFGSKYLDGKRAVYPEDLDAWEKKFNIHPGPGDALLFRTGRWARRAAEGAWRIMENSAGLHASCLPWLKKRDVAVVGSDLATDVMPSGIEGIVLPVHLVLIRGMGVPILDHLDLEAVSEFAASRQRWEFLLTVAPLVVEGGTGSPINPLAAF